MAHDSQSRSVHQKLKEPLFGATPKPAIKTERDLAAELNARLKEKYRGYDRAAARLELRGEHDAANVLRRAASRVRLLRNAPQTATQPFADASTPKILLSNTKT